MSDVAAARFQDARVPTAPLVKYVQAFVRKYGAADPVTNFTDGRIPLQNPIDYLTERARCSRTLIERLARPAAKNAAKTIEFNVADRLLCAMDGPMTWYEDDELREAYLSANLATPHFPGCGHLKTDDNILRNYIGSLYCRTCALESRRRSMRKLREERRAA